MAKDWIARRNPDFRNQARVEDVSEEGVAPVSVLLQFQGAHALTMAQNIGGDFRNRCRAVEK